MKEHETVTSDLSASVLGIDETVNHSINGTDNTSGVDSISDSSVDGVNHSTNTSTPDSDNSTGNSSKRHCSDNLITLAERTKEEQRIITQLGGRASGEARRKKKHMREIAQALLAHEMTEEQISDVLGTAESLLDGDRTVAAVLTARMIQEAADGNYKAFEVLRDTAGYKPREEVAVESMTDADRALLARIEARQKSC